VSSLSRYAYALKLIGLKNYLEDSTAVLVRSIQPLVNTIRAPNTNYANPNSIVADYVRDINSTVQDIVAKTNNAVYELQNPALSRHAPPVVKVLESNAAQLVQLMEENKGNELLPPIAFRIARATKVCLILQVNSRCNPNANFLASRNSFFVLIASNQVNLRLK
jgi:hypothetical protein